VACVATLDIQGAESSRILDAHAFLQSDVEFGVDALVWKAAEKIETPIDGSQLPHMAKFGAALMLKGQKAHTMTRRIAADTPVERGRSAQGVEPLAPAGAVPPNLPSHQSATLSIRLIVARLPLAYLPKLLMCWISHLLRQLWRREPSLAHHMSG
jgi:hypothetical protein